MDIQFTSILAPYIEGLIKEKRANGYKYDTEIAILARFDKYCVDKGLNELNITKDFMDDWMMKSDSEGNFNQGKRISCVRQVLKYMASLGIPVYLPENFCHFKRALPHIFDSNEIKAFFDVLDKKRPPYNRPATVRLHVEYRLIFRTFCCCGLRNSEVLKLKNSDVDLDNGILTIRDSKGNKDRLVYLPAKLYDSFLNYRKWMLYNFQFNSEWFFPSYNPDKPFPASSMDRVFNETWMATPFCNCTNKPTVHDFRFTFVVKRLNKWAEEGVDLGVMLPYLSRYLGHKTVKETLYYYFLVEQAYSTIEKKDTIANSVIPEANDEQYQYCLF